jgi:uncharacterized membrane protein YgcG
VIFVHDAAGVFSPAAVARVEARIEAMRERTGDELVVVTVASLPGVDGASAVREQAWNAFAQRGVHGALLYVDRDDRRDALIAQPETIFPPATRAALVAALDRSFAQGEYDGGLERLAASVDALYRRDATPPSATNAAPRPRVWAIVAGAALAYLLIRGTLRRGGA